MAATHEPKIKDIYSRDVKNIYTKYLVVEVLLNVVALEEKIYHTLVWVTKHELDTKFTHMGSFA